MLDKPRLLDLVRDRIRVKHYSLRTEQAYVYWSRKYIRFSHKRHPRDLGKTEIEVLLTQLGADHQVAAQTFGRLLNAAAGPAVPPYRRVSSRGILVGRDRRARRFGSRW